MSSCICQYFIAASKANNSLEYSASHMENKQSEKPKGQNTSPSSDISATELAAAHAEIWSLKHNLNESRICQENIEIVLKNTIEKQNDMLREIYQLKGQNSELKMELQMQRSHHIMERNALLKELNNIKILLSERTQLLEESTKKISELTNAVLDANEQIYSVGKKYFNLQQTSENQLSSIQNSDSEKDQDDVDDDEDEDNDVDADDDDNDNDYSDNEDEEDDEDAEDAEDVDDDDVDNESNSSDNTNSESECNDNDSERECNVKLNCDEDKNKNGSTDEHQGDTSEDEYSTDDANNFEYT